MLIGIMLTTPLLDLSTLLDGDRGGIWVEEGFELHAHYCLKILSVRKTKTRKTKIHKAVFEPRVSTILAILAESYRIQMIFNSKGWSVYNFQFISDHTPITCFVLYQFCVNLPYLLSEFTTIVPLYHIT